VNKNNKKNLKQKFAKKLRQDKTKPENILWYKLRDRRFLEYKFRRQVLIGNYIVDFICFKRNLIIELDGSQHAEQEEYDKLRTHFLNTEGFKVIRFWNSRILTELEDVLWTIENELYNQSKNMNNRIIRQLKNADLQDFFNLRLKSLQESPESFLSSYEEESNTGPSLFQHIFKPQKDDNVVFGAFVQGKLVGAIGVFQKKYRNEKHKCTIWGMYVQPEYRNQGIGQELVNTAIAHAKNKTHCIALHLSVESTNISAKKLYESCGFKVWGTELKAKKIGLRFYDSLHMIQFI
jgi:very-short-patch-repair endonuclease/RimJ/RimL family protein N-acetyltransferase